MAYRDQYRKNRVALVRDMRSQDIICAHLVEKHIFSISNEDEVCCQSTNSKKNSELINIVSRRGQDGFTAFLDAMEMTEQHDLRAKMSLDRPVVQQSFIPPRTVPVTIQPVLRTPVQISEPAPVEEATDPSNECTICMDNKINTALIPCGHSFCPTCAHQMRTCPTCRAPITQRLRLFM